MILKFRFYLFFTAFIAYCLLPTAYSAGQARIVSLGIQYKPIFPVGFLGTGTQSVYDQGIQYDIALKSGFNAGMIIRKGLTNLFALETGISYVKRTYNLDITDGAHTEGSSFRMIGYEIPLSALVYIRLGEYIFMNVSMGAAADMYASNVESQGENHTSLTVRNHIFQPALLANLGWELRTIKSGYFYLGASFHRAFTNEFTTRMDYKKMEPVYQSLSGAYLTFDVRYFFHADPPKKRRANDVNEVPE